MNFFFLALAVGLFIFFLGYRLGKRTGRQLGRRESDALWPLFIRQKSLAEGYCIVCGQKSQAICHDNFADSREKIT